ncbi:RING-type domain-containing protein [Chloropicon primus]|uniref:RING-type domain-containing protein n=2 Tax=Chloropicon primus TaxID=1764295 RepID=A0A5B8MIM9_9CHLO|nr:hypothetical protein A3770_04p28250 [Chloropicon primus]UPQ99517.1 RING-type domain-containing protein [Chloropicon primus]|eukprot:QDZ20307.1 hypothetical protein A3770_04p28250 [Chloropicon primus]
MEQGSQTEDVFVFSNQDVKGYLVSLDPQERQRVFSTSKDLLKRTLEANSPAQCSRCSFTSYALRLFGAQDASPSTSAWMSLPPGKLLTLLSPPNIVNPLQFVWKDDDRVFLGDTLLQDDRLFSSFLNDKLSIQAAAVARGRMSFCEHKYNAPKQSEIDCSLRRLTVQENQAARLEMFCDQILLDYVDDLNAAVCPADGQVNEPDIELLLSENTLSPLEFENRLKDFENQLEAKFYSQADLCNIKRQLQECASQIKNRKKRLETAAARHIEEGSKCLILLLLSLCWQRAFSEFFKHISRTRAMDDLYGIESNSKDEDLKAQLHREETKAKCLGVELETLQAEVSSLASQVNELDPPSKDLDAMPLSRLEEILSRLDDSTRRVRSKRDRLVEDMSKCGICWFHKKEVAFGCGHQVCAACSPKIEQCHICRKQVDLRVRLF